MGQGNYCCAEREKDDVFRVFEGEDIRENYQKYLKEFLKEPKIHEICVVRQPVLLRSLQSNCSFNSSVQMLIYHVELITWLNEYYQFTVQFNPQRHEIMKLWMQFLALIRNKSKLLSSAGFMEFYARTRPNDFPIGKQVDTCEVLYAMLEDLLKCEEYFEEKILKSLYVMGQSQSLKCEQCSHEWTRSQNSFGITSLDWERETLQKNIETYIQLLPELRNGTRTSCPKCSFSKTSIQNAKFLMPSYLFIRLSDLVPMKLTGLLSEREVTIGEKLYELTQIAVFEGNRRNGHYYVIRFFENLGWKLIENDFADSLTGPTILKETFYVKMLVLEEKLEK